MDIAAKECAQNGITTFDKVVLTAFALSYSVMTTVSVFALRKLFPVLVFAVLDGLAVYMRINIDLRYGGKTCGKAQRSSCPEKATSAAAS